MIYTIYMSNFSIKLEKDKINKLKELFKDDIKQSNNQYIDTFIQNDDITISIYTNDKVVFQGKDAFVYASGFIDKQENRQAGSDEVGTGDVFGPVVVCACIIEKEDYPYIESKHLTDSKQLTDEYIRSIGEELINRFQHSLLILNNEKYNEVHETNNLNQIKAKMHNKAYINMIDKGYNIPSEVYLDQFCSIENYFYYLADEKQVFRNIIFETKAESKYPAVAVASIIARYAFLVTMDNLNNKYHIKFQKGAVETEKIDKQIQYIIEKYGKDELKKVGKWHFKNFDNYR